MFRPMRRSKQSLPQEECISLLQTEPRGVLALHGEDGYPYALPLDQLYLDGKLYFHCAKEGHKLDAIAADARACFCLMDQGYRNAGEWALNIKSVVVFGHIKTVDDPQESRRILKQLGQKLYPSQEKLEQVLEQHAAQATVLEMSIDHITGKLVNES